MIDARVKVADAIQIQIKPSLRKINKETTFAWVCEIEWMNPFQQKNSEKEVQTQG